VLAHGGNDPPIVGAGCREEGAVDMANEGCVAASGVRKSFGDVEVIKGIDLVIARGSIVGLIGPSGCGKTTTVRLLVGLLAPTAGRATVFGTSSSELTAQQRQRIGYLPQIPALFPDLSLWENLSFHASMYGLRLRRKPRLSHVLKWVELFEDRKKKVRDASGGMQRRLALAAAFVHDPEIVFLDEPTAGIDPILRSKFWEQFREMRDEGRAICVTTQYVGEAAYCDVVGLMSDGQLLLVDTPENLRRAAFGGEVVDIELLHPADADHIADVIAGPDIVNRLEQLDARRWRIVVADAGPATERITAALRASGVDVVEIAEHVVDYDEAFVRVIERHRLSAAAESA
jgi:ABC-2 type transport system ATP-binding protein